MASGTLNSPARPLIGATQKRPPNGSFRRRSGSTSSRKSWPSVFASASSTCYGIGRFGFRRSIAISSATAFSPGCCRRSICCSTCYHSLTSTRAFIKLSDLPDGYQSEIQSIIETAHRRDIVGQLEKKMEGKPRGMMFFKWYGKNLDTSVEIPEYHQPFRYVRTIGVSVFSKKQSTGKHFGPLRLTLRVLYNVNTIDNRKVFIQVGDQIHYWRDEKLFIFDDTLQHQSCNESEKVRYCMFVDILRPSLFPRASSAMLAGFGWSMTRFRALFYQHWTFLK